MWWERDEREPAIRFYPAIVAFLGYEPWPKPRTLPEALLAERRRRGIEIHSASELVGVDEGTWGRWERSVWKPTPRMISLIDHFLGLSLHEKFPTDIR